MVDPYKVLGLGPQADEEQIRRAWAQALKQAKHGQGPSPEEVHEARRILTDPRARAQWELEHLPDLWAQALEWPWSHGGEAVWSHLLFSPAYPDFQPRLVLELVEEWLRAYAQAQEVPDPWEEDGRG